MIADQPPDNVCPPDVFCPLDLLGPPDVLCPPDLLGPPLNPDAPAQYRICAQGVFSPSWLDMLSGEWVISEQPEGRSGTTTLVGRVADQAALVGVLEQLYCLGLPLLSIECLTPCRSFV